MNSLEENERLPDDAGAETEEVEVPGEEPVTEEEIMDPEEAASDDTVDNEEHESSSDPPAEEGDTNE